MSWRVRIVTRLGGLHLDVELASDNRPLAVIGPNGSGKTTILRAIAGAHRPTEAGEIRIDDAVLFDHDRGIDVPIEARRIGYVPQGYGLFPHLRVIDNVGFGVAGDRQTRRRRARKMLQTLDAAFLADRLPRHLSGGERQRVALARALVMEPRMLLFDEPTAALDVRARRAVRTVLAEYLAISRRPSIVVTHDARDVAALSATVCVIEEGQVAQRGELHDLRAAPASDFVAEFVGVE